jgi:hypothetical protein
MVSEGVVGKTENGKYYLQTNESLKAGKPADPEE